MNAVVAGWTRRIRLACAVGLPVDGPPAGQEDQPPHSGPQGSFKDVSRANHVYVAVVVGILHGTRDADLGRGVNDKVRPKLVDHRYRRWVADVLPDQSDTLRDRLHSTRREVIDHLRSVAAIEERANEARPDEPGAACYKHPGAHGRRLYPQQVHSRRPGAQ